MPSWSHLHPLIVHFPIALLMVAPLVVFTGMLWPSQRRGIRAIAILLLGLGSLAAVLAIATGLAAAGPAHRTPELMATVTSHENSAERTTLLYAGLTVALILIHLVPVISRREMSRRLMLILHLLWLLSSVGATLSLIQTGRLGGRMVHELDIHGGT